MKSRFKAALIVCRRFNVLFLVTALCMLLISCGGGGGSSNPPPSVQTIKWQADGSGAVQFLTNDAQYYKYIFWSTYTGTNEAQMTTVTATVKKQSGSLYGGFGIVFCYQDSNNFYHLLIDSAGHYSVYTKVAGTYYAIIPWTTVSSAHLNSGFGVENVISVVQQSPNSFSVIFNGIQEVVFSAGNFTGGVAGFCASVADQAGENFPAVPEDIRFKLSSPIVYPPDLVSQKTWVRAHLDDVYLWYNEIIDVPPANYATAPAYFDALLVKSRDRFSFSMPLAATTNLLQEGLETGYGVKWGWAASGRLFAYYVDPNSPAAAAITRGTELTAINGQSVASMTTDSLSSALFPAQPGAGANLTFRPPGTSSSQSSGLTSASYYTTTVEPPKIISLASGGKAGYLLFNEHLRPSEQELVDALTYFKQQGITELVLDLRYNTGGYLFIAEELASMIAGSPVQGQVFEKLLFNDKHPEKTNDPRNTMRFSSLDSTNTQLPLLGLTRLFVLTGSNTCSASEAIINGLLPYIPVVRIGWTTCGKPYGSAQNNCGQQAYFALQFEGVNANGSDDYKSGFTPTCQVTDDLNYPLGDIREARLDAALYYMSHGFCPTATTVTLPKAVPVNATAGNGDGQLLNQRPGLKLMK
jgi:C-terminal processing protease CtpA/Prc